MSNDKSISRRRFLGVAAGATGAAAVGPWSPSALARDPGWDDDRDDDDRDERSIPRSRLGI